MMEFIYEIKDKSEVTEEEYNQLDWLRFKDGYIWPAFQKFPGLVILCKNGDKIVGWSFCFCRNKKSINTFYLYIHKDYRRNGIGTKLYQINSLFNNNDEKMTVSKWSEGARRFYESVGR